MAETDSLAAKLDKDLNNYVDEVLEKNKNYRYAHPLSEENWEEVWLLFYKNRANYR
jgi:hypothetical protein